MVSPNPSPYMATEQLPLDNNLEPCADVIVSLAAGAAARRSVLVGAAWAVKFPNFSYLFQRLFSKELLLSRYDVEQLFCCDCLASNSKIYYKNRRSVTKRCKNQAG